MAGYKKKERKKLSFLFHLFVVVTTRIVVVALVILLSNEQSLHTGDKPYTIIEDTFAAQSYQNVLKQT